MNKLLCSRGNSYWSITGRHYLSFWFYRITKSVRMPVKRFSSTLYSILRISRNYDAFHVLFVSIQKMQIINSGVAMSSVMIVLLLGGNRIKHVLCVDKCSEWTSEAIKRWYFVYFFLNQLSSMKLNLLDFSFSVESYKSDEGNLFHVVKTGIQTIRQVNKHTKIIYYIVLKTQSNFALQRIQRCHS